MPLQAGIDARGALQHIILRGTEQRGIFKNDTDRDDFIDRLGNIALPSVPERLNILAQSKTTTKQPRVQILLSVPSSGPTEPGN
jgi:hypothetical protein